MNLQHHFMALVLEFDAKNNILRGSLKDRVTDAILLESYAEAARFAKSRPPCRAIWDFSEVTDFDVSSHTIRKLVGTPPIVARGYMRVVVAPNDFLFGMMRMLQILSEQSRPELHVVRTMAEAYRLLQIESPEFSVVKPEVGEV